MQFLYIMISNELAHERCDTVWSCVNVYHIHNLYENALIASANKYGTEELIIIPIRNCTYIVI